MNLEKYIQELLLENETVIIPGFGAFISSYKPAEINTDTNELKPPSKEIIFNQQIRNNDGLLVGSVALGEGVSHFDALKLIEKERENIVYQLDKGEKVILKETGELSVNEQNEIKFIPFFEENMSLDSFGLENVLLEDSIQDTKEENTGAVIKEEVEQPEKKESEPVLISKPIIPETKSEPVFVQNNSKAPEKEEKKKRSWLWFLLILIPIIIVGFYLLKQESNNKTTPPQAVEESPQIIQKEVLVESKDTIIEDSIPLVIQDSSDRLEIEKPLEKPAVDSPKFYLVGGSFKAEENAENYLIELKSKGLEPFHLGKRGNFYIVAIGKYQTGKEAVIAKRQFNEANPKSGIWIMEEKETK